MTGHPSLTGLMLGGQKPKKQKMKEKGRRLNLNHSNLIMQLKEVFWKTDVNGWIMIWLQLLIDCKKELLPMGVRW